MGASINVKEENIISWKTQIEAYHKILKVQIGHADIEIEMAAKQEDHNFLWARKKELEDKMKDLEMALKSITEINNSFYNHKDFIDRL